MFKFNGGQGALVCDICHTIVQEPAQRPSESSWEDVSLCTKCNLLPVTVPRGLLLDAVADILQLVRTHRAPRPASVRELFAAITKKRAEVDTDDLKAKMRAVRTRITDAVYELSRSARMGLTGGEARDMVLTYLWPHIERELEAAAADERGAIVAHLKSCSTAFDQPTKGIVLGLARGLDNGSSVTGSSVTCFAPASPNAQDRAHAGSCAIRRWASLEDERLANVRADRPEIMVIPPQEQRPACTCDGLIGKQSA